MIKSQSEQDLIWECFHIQLRITLRKKEHHKVHKLLWHQMSKEILNQAKGNQETVRERLTEVDQHPTDLGQRVKTIESAVLQKSQSNLKQKKSLVKLMVRSKFRSFNSKSQTQRPHWDISSISSTRKLSPMAKATQSFTQDSVSIHMILTASLT